MRHKRCETCGAWEQTSLEHYIKKFREVYYGVCRKHSPLNHIWPPRKSSEWCLEWVPQEDDPGDVLERPDMLYRILDRINQRARDMLPLEKLTQHGQGHYGGLLDARSIIEEERNREQTKHTE